MVSGRGTDGGSEGIRDAHAALTRDVIDLPGVSGTSVGISHGKPCLTVHIERREARLLRKIPAKIGGFDVVVEETGRFRRED